MKYTFLWLPEVDTCDITINNGSMNRIVFLDRIAKLVLIFVRMSKQVLRKLTKIRSKVARVNFELLREKIRPIVSILIKSYLDTLWIKLPSETSPFKLFLGEFGCVPLALPLNNFSLTSSVCSAALACLLWATSFLHNRFL